MRSAILFLLPAVTACGWPPVDFEIEAATPVRITYTVAGTTQTIHADGPWTHEEPAPPGSRLRLEARCDVPGCPLSGRILWGGAEIEYDASFYVSGASGTQLILSGYSPGGPWPFSPYRASGQASRAESAGSPAPTAR